MRAKIPRSSCTLPLILLLVLVRALGDEPSEDVRATLADLASAYDIEVEVVETEARFSVTTFHGAIEGARASEEQLQDYVPLLAEEFSLYPAAFVKRSRLERIVLCTELSFAGQLRTAIPDFEHDVLYLDVARGAYDPSYQRKAVHHEFFHVVDWRDDGHVYEDREWCALNPTDFEYGTGGVNAQDQPDTGVLTDRYPGFLNHYSTTGVEEDKAEIFVHLLVASAHVDRVAKKDKVVRAKADRMRALLAAFCPDIDAEFWKDVKELERADD